MRPSFSFRTSGDGNSTRVVTPSTSNVSEHVVARKKERLERETGGSHEGARSSEHAPGDETPKNSTSSALNIPTPRSPERSSDREEGSSRKGSTSDRSSGCFPRFSDLYLGPSERQSTEPQEPDHSDRRRSDRRHSDRLYSDYRRDGDSSDRSTALHSEDLPDLSREQRIVLEQTLNRINFVDKAIDEDEVTVQQEMRRESSRIHKWNKMLGDSSGHLVASSRTVLSARRSRKLLSMVHKGIPEALRGQTWMMMSGAQDLMEVRSQKFGEIRSAALQQGSIPNSVAEGIEKGLKRTFPEHAILAAEAGAETGEVQGVLLMRNILRSYAYYDKEVVYSQTMNYICGALIMYNSEEESFWLLVQLMYGLNFRLMFDKGMTLLIICMEELDIQLKKMAPRLHKHLETQECPPSLYAYQWFATLGLDTLPISISARLLDMIFFERNLAPLFRFTLALLVEDQKKLLSVKGADLVARLKNLPKNLTDPNSFLINKVAMLRLRLPAGFYSQTADPTMLDGGPTYAPYTDAMHNVS